MYEMKKQIQKNRTLRISLLAHLLARYDLGH